MAVTKKNINGAFYFTYPSADVFLKERNYFVFEGVQDDTYIKTVNIGNKTLNFGRYHLIEGEKFYLDVSAYYAKYYGKFNVVITYENIREEVVTNTIAINATTYDCYDPFKEIVPDRCGDAPYARIVPPYRMLCDGKKNTTSMLAAVRDSDRFSGYEYEMESVPYANYRPSNAWLTTEQKNEHLGETYRNTLPATGRLSDLDSNGLPLWIEQGYLRIGATGITFEEQRVYNANYCRLKTIFMNYNGLTIGDIPNGMQKIIIFYNANKEHVASELFGSGLQTLNNANNYPYISIVFKKEDESAITPSDLVGITSSTLTNPEAGKSYRWVIENNEYKWVELTAEQLINERFFWSINGKNDASEVLNKQFEFGKIINANLVFQKDLSPLVPPHPTPKFEVLQSVKRSVSIADGSMPYVYIRWRTPWGVTVEHLFYLGTYSSDKADAKELESVNYYEELSNHVRVGSFYLDGITQPYDLFYYKTLETSELVEMYFPSYSFKPATYMPNGDDYVAIKIKGSDASEAVVDGVSQRVITFKFEFS